MTERPGAPSAERASQRTRSSSRLTTIALLCVVAAMPAAAVACGSNEESKSFDTSTATTSTGSGAGGGSSSTTGAGGDIFDDAGTGAPVAIAPLDPILKVELPLQSQTMKFDCVDPNTGAPVAATWKLSNLEVGTIDATGLFTPNGDRPGKVTVTCEFNGDKAGTELSVLIHAEDNQGGLTTSQTDILRGPPGLADPQWQFMYPYDGTVFPKGILAPEIHLTTGSAASNAYYVHVVLPDYEYEGFFNNAPTNTQLQMSQDAWEALTNAAKGATVEVHISKIFNGAKYGPIYRTWTMANGTLHGTIYYNTYDSPLAGQTGAMMRIKGNSPTPEVLVGNCTVCHSVLGRRVDRCRREPQRPRRDLRPLGWPAEPAARVDRLGAHRVLGALSEERRGPRDQRRPQLQLAAEHARHQQHLEQRALHQGGHAHPEQRHRVVLRAVARLLPRRQDARVHRPLRRLAVPERPRADGLRRGDAEVHQLPRAAHAAPGPPPTRGRRSRPTANSSCTRTAPATISRPGAATPGSSSRSTPRPKRSCSCKT
jgi:hypothetical protein